MASESLETVVAEVINDLYSVEQTFFDYSPDYNLNDIADARQKLERAVQGEEDGEM